MRPPPTFRPLVRRLRSPPWDAPDAGRPPQNHRRGDRHPIGEEAGASEGSQRGKLGSGWVWSALPLAMDGRSWGAQARVVARLLAPDAFGGDWPRAARVPRAPLVRAHAGARRGQARPSALAGVARRRRAGMRGALRGWRAYVRRAPALAVKADRLLLMKRVCLRSVSFFGHPFQLSPFGRTRV